MNGFQLIFVLNAVVPGASAAVDDSYTFAQNDPYGLMMALLGMGIVFSALVMLYLIFSNTPKLYTQSFKTRLRSGLVFKKKSHVQTVAAQPQPETTDSLTGEVNAAIAAAIYLYRTELHDFEDTVLTIKKVARTYSPWSSKIYGLRNVLPGK